MSKMLDMLKRHEGLKLKPYKCSAGKLTIGYGRNLDDRGITEKEAEYMLHNDILYCISQLDLRLPWWKDQPDTIREVLINMCFNLGIGGLLGFKKTLALLQMKEYEKASREMLDSRWAIQVGRRALELSEMVKNTNFKC
jgi:lysozyme